MNIFFTDANPEIAAYNLCKVHVNKMILETAQMLSTAHRMIDGDDIADNAGLYRKTHYNHPSSVWIRTSEQNYNWAYRHLAALCEVYTMSTGKVHKTEEKLLKTLSCAPTGILPHGLTPFAVAVDDDLKKSEKDPVQAYRKYMIRKYKEWSQREKPIKVEFPVAKPDWMF